MKLYDLSWGPWPRRVTIYLKEKGITDIEIVPLQYGDQNEPEMLAKNPLRFIPVLELDDGTCVFDSLAIMEFLEELYPSPNFIGQTTTQRARMRTYLNVINELYVRALPIYANTIPQFSRVTKQDAKVSEWLKPFFDRSIASLEQLASSTGPFLMGDQVSMADCALYPLEHHNVENFDLSFLTPKYPKLHRWAKMFSQRESAPCPLRNDGLREADTPPPRPDGKPYWWQKLAQEAESSSS